MSMQRRFCLLTAMLVGSSAMLLPYAGAAAPSSAPSEAASSFLGRWDLTLKTPTRPYPSWLEIYQVQGQFKANMVGRWGNARPLAQFEISHGSLTFTSPKEEENRATDMVFKARLVGGKLIGTTTGPDGSVWTWVGERAPLLEPTAPPKWGKTVSLFNGKNLEGWHEYSANPFPESGSHWSVADGTLVTPGHGPELATDRNFQDFKLHLEFNCGPASNSGVYLRGRYELQVENESEEEPPSHHTGGIYGFLVPHPELPRTTGTWQTYDITLIGRRVTVVQNGQTVIDNQVIPGITGGAIDSHEALPAADDGPRASCLRPRAAPATIFPAPHGRLTRSRPGNSGRREQPAHASGVRPRDWLPMLDPPGQTADRRNRSSREIGPPARRTPQAGRN